MKKIMYKYVDPITRRHYHTVIEDWNEETHGEWPYEHPTTNIVEINIEEETLVKKVFKQK